MYVYVYMCVHRALFGPVVVGYPGVEANFRFLCGKCEFSLVMHTLTYFIFNMRKPVGKIAGTRTYFQIVGVQRFLNLLAFYSKCLFMYFIYNWKKYAADNSSINI